MIINKQMTSWAACAAMVLCVPALNAQEAPYIFRSGEDGYKAYRIPAIVKNLDGSLLAMCEGRVAGPHDSGNIDIVGKRSTDGGKTWGELIMIRDDGNKTAGNPAPVVDPVTGDVYLISCASAGSEHQNMKGEVPREVYFQVSKDGGQTWSESTDITTQTKKADWGWYATGPCNAIIITEGKHKGRIVVPTNMSEMEGGKAMYRGSSIYSDDKGISWSIGETADNGANESTIAEVSENLIVQNFRMQTHGKGKRTQRYSKDGGATWSPIEHVESLPAPVCQGSIIRDEHTPGILYYSGPAGPGRTNMTIRMSKDGGKTWPSVHRISEGRHAYSNLVDLNKELLGILFEDGRMEGDPHKEGIVFDIVEKSVFEAK